MPCTPEQAAVNGARVADSVHIDDGSDVDLAGDLDGELAGADQMLADASASTAQPLFQAGASVEPSATLP